MTWKAHPRAKLNKILDPGVPGVHVYNYVGTFDLVVSGVILWSYSTFSQDGMQAENGWP